MQSLFCENVFSGGSLGKATHSSDCCVCERGLAPFFDFALFGAFMSDLWRDLCSDLCADLEPVGWLSSVVLAAKSPSYY